MFNGELRQKLVRFGVQWTFFVVYVLVCACIVMLLEDQDQKLREFKRDLRWNQTKSKLLTSMESCSLNNNVGGGNCNSNYENMFKEIMEVAGETVTEVERDQHWDLVNSLYYCSSLYTTVGTNLTSRKSDINYIPSKKT
jgi:hypothetical protein